MRSKKKSKKGQVTGQQMIAYMQAQEKMRSEPVPGLNTPKIQLKLADIFSPLRTNICQPNSMKCDVKEIQYERADFHSSELVENRQRADFNDLNLGEIGVQSRGHKKSDILRSCGVKSEVGSKDELSLTFEIVTTTEIPYSEQDPGQGGLCQNQP